MHWSPGEDAALLEWAARSSKKLHWGSASAHMRAHGHLRSSKQCRERYCNHLAPILRHDPWSAEDTYRLVEELRLHGPRWCKIAEGWPGRAPNDIKKKADSLGLMRMANKSRVMPRRAASVERASFCMLSVETLGTDPGDASEAIELPLHGLNASAMRVLPPSAMDLQYHHLRCQTQMCLNDQKAAIMRWVLSCGADAVGFAPSSRIPGRLCDAPVRRAVASHGGQTPPPFSSTFSMPAPDDGDKDWSLSRFPPLAETRRRPGMDADTALWCDQVLETRRRPGMDADTALWCDQVLETRRRSGMDADAALLCDEVLDA
jgi:hypothetical protein